MYRPRPFGGFPWWLPPAAAALAALITFLIVGSAEAVWSAEARVWIRGDQLAPDQVEPLFDDPWVLETTLDLSLSSLSRAELAEAIEVVREERLFTVSVAAGSRGEAEELAIVLANLVVEESYVRNLGSGYAEVLGVAWPGARQVAPRAAPQAALAGLGGLAGGLAVAAALTRRERRRPPSSLALLGRRGWRPIAVIGERDANGSGEPPPSALQLADALQAAQGTASARTASARTASAHTASAHTASAGAASAGPASAGTAPAGGTTTAFAPLHEHGDAALAALQAARALAGRDLAVLWLDARPERPEHLVLLALPNGSPPPAPLLPLDPEGAPPWLQGMPLPSWGERIRRLIDANAQRFDAIILVLGPVAEDARSREAAAAADRIVLAARDDFDASGPEAARTAAALRAAPPVLGIALTHASNQRAKNFEAALEAAREEAD